MLSLIGIPCFPVFMGKLYVFGSVTDKGLYWFATIGALNAAVAAFYYNASPESDADRRWKWHYDPTPGSFPQSSIRGFYRRPAHRFLESHRSLDCCLVQLFGGI